jgi:hypothetical protein
MSINLARNIYVKGDGIDEGVNDVYNDDDDKQLFLDTLIDDLKGRVTQKDNIEKLEYFIKVTNHPDTTFLEFTKTGNNYNIKFILLNNITHTVKKKEDLSSDTISNSINELYDKLNAKYNKNASQESNEANKLRQSKNLVNKNASQLPIHSTNSVPVLPQPRRLVAKRNRNWRWLVIIIFLILLLVGGIVYWRV